MVLDVDEEIRHAYISGHMRRALYDSAKTKKFSDRLFDARQDYADWISGYSREKSPSPDQPDTAE